MKARVLGSISAKPGEEDSLSSASLPRIGCPLGRREPDGAGFG